MINQIWKYLYILISKTYNCSCNIVNHINNRILCNHRMSYWKKKTHNRVAKISGVSSLSVEQKQCIKDYYAPYFKCDTLFHEFYSLSTGIFDKKYIPDDFYYGYIDPFFNDWNEAKFLDNKSYYSLLFPDIKQPDTVAVRRGGIWFDRNDIIINYNDMIKRCNYKQGVFIKNATDSWGGSGVYYVDNQVVLESTIKEIKKDIVIQKPIKQHEILNTINDSSVNTIRIISLLSSKGVKVYSAILRMGVNGSKVDNASSGGITCGINADGRLKSVAYSTDGKKYTRHPTSHIAFDDIVVPSYSEALEMVREMHLKMSHFKLISWDIAISEDGEPVFIEMNLSNGELDFHQLNNGPLFKEDTEKILSEVFKYNDKERNI